MTTPERLTDDELTAALEVCERATPGPWIVGWAARRCNADHDHADESTCNVVACHWFANTDEDLGSISTRDGRFVIQTTSEYGLMAADDSAFIALARTLLPTVIRELQAARDRLLSLECAYEQRDKEMRDTYEVLRDANIRIAQLESERDAAREALAGATDRLRDVRSAIAIAHFDIIDRGEDVKIADLLRELWRISGGDEPTAADEKGGDGG